MQPQVEAVKDTGISMGSRVLQASCRPEMEQGKNKKLSTRASDEGSAVRLSVVKGITGYL